MALNKAVGRDSHGKRGEGDGIEGGGLAALMSPESFASVVFSLRRNRFLKICSRNLRRCLLPAQRAPKRMLLLRFLLLTALP